MIKILENLAYVVERGKINAAAPFPQDLKGKEGADEWIKKAIEGGISPQLILSEGLIKGMNSIGVKFRENKVFVPEVLMAAKAMSSAMVFLKPFFDSGDIQKKGTLVIGTVAGDLHDIGKNLVAMIVEGAGWEIVDLGVNANGQKFEDAVQKNPGCVVGLSALLTTTMANMGKIIADIKSKSQNTKIIIGGAPVTREFSEKIGADFYAPGPQGAVDYLNSL